MSTRGKCKRPLKKMTVNSENRGQNASLRSRRGSISGILRRLLTNNEKQRWPKPAVLKPTVVCAFGESYAPNLKPRGLDLARISSK